MDGVIETTSSSSLGPVAIAANEVPTSSGLATPHPEDGHHRGLDQPKEKQQSLATSPRSGQSSAPTPAPSGMRDSASITSPPAASTSRSKIFLKSSSPELPLHFFLQSQIAHSTARQLQVAIRSHAGVTESRFGKADFILVDPQHPVAARKLMREAKQMGQPIPVVTFDFVLDSVQQGRLLEKDAQRYNLERDDGVKQVPTILAPPTRPLNGRNPFTDKEREQIIDYFVDRDPSTWSLNAAAKELAERIPTHTKTSYQTFLQQNFEKNWNLKKQILLRQEQLDRHVQVLDRQHPSRSESLPNTPLQASPANVGPSRTSRNAQRTPSVQEEEDSPDEDLAVRIPKPGAHPTSAELAPPKSVLAAGATVSQSPEIGPTASQRHATDSDTNNRARSPASPAIDEESEPEGGWSYSKKILADLGKKANAKLIQKRAHRIPATDSSDDDDLEYDQLESSTDAEDDQPDARRETAGLVQVPISKGRRAASEDAEWEGSRRVDNSLLAKDKNRVIIPRVKFLDEEVHELLSTLATLVRKSRRDGQDTAPLLDRPPDHFWGQFASENPQHSAMSWKSHYLKNRPTYKKIVEYRLEEDDDSDDSGESASSDVDGRLDAAADEGPETRSLHVNRGAEAELAVEQSIRQNGANTVAEEGEERPPPPPPDDELEEMRQVEAEIEAETGAASDVPEDVSVDKQPHILVEIPYIPTHIQTAASVDQGEGDQDEAASEEGEEEGDEEASEEREEEDGEEELVAREHSEVEGRERSERIERGGEEETEESRNEVEHVQESEEGGLDSGAMAGQPVSLTPRKARSTRLSDTGIPQTISNVSPNRSNNAGVPLLSQHRDAQFYDFTMDSDEEDRLLRSRSRASMRKSFEHVRTMSNGNSRTRQVHAANTPSRSSRPRSKKLSSPDGDEIRAERTREWARSVSASSASLSPEQASPFVARSTSGGKLTIQRSQSRATALLDSSLGERSLRRRGSTEGFVPSSREPYTPPRSKQPNWQVMPQRARQQLGDDPLRLQQHHELEKQKYREQFKDFCFTFTLDKKVAYAILKQFRASIKDAWLYLEEWCQGMAEAYGVEGSVALEYVKTAGGDFEDAERFIKLSAMTSPSRSGPSRSDVPAHSPRKRRATHFNYSREDDRHLGGVRDLSSKRHRRQSNLS